jgi:hypothetical protein
MHTNRRNRLFIHLLAPLAMLLWLAGMPNALAGDEFKTTTTSASGRTTTTQHSHGGAVSSDKLQQGQFYKSEPSSWSKSTSRTYFQDGKGEVKAQDKATGLPVGVKLYESTGEANVWKGETEGWAGKASLATIGADYKATGMVGKKDGNYYAQGNLRGRAYLLKAEVETAKLGLGDDDLGVHISAKGDAIVGVEGTLTGTAKVGKDGVALEAKAEVFAGAKANGQIPLTVSLCKMKASGILKGEVSAGAGAKASGTITVDWATGTAKISGELAATLGLGAGAGAEVVIDLSALVSDPGAVADCLLDGVKELASAAVELGGDLVDAAGQALSTAGSAIADGASAIASGTVRATKAVGSAISNAGSAVASFFGFGSDPAPPTPRTPPGSNMPLRSNTRTNTTVVVMVPMPSSSGRPSPTRALRAHRQAYPH